MEVEIKQAFVLDAIESDILNMSNGGRMSPGIYIAARKAVCACISLDTMEACFTFKGKARNSSAPQCRFAKASLRIIEGRCVFAAHSLTF